MEQIVRDDVAVVLQPYLWNWHLLLGMTDDPRLLGRLRVLRRLPWTTPGRLAIFRGFICYIRVLRRFVRLIISSRFSTFESFFISHIEHANVSKGKQNVSLAP